MKPGTYKISGVEMTVNEAGCLVQCNDWEAVYERRSDSPAHVGTHSQYVKQGFGGAHFVTDAFREYIEVWYGA